MLKHNLCFDVNTTLGTNCLVTLYCNSKSEHLTTWHQCRSQGFMNAELTRLRNDLQVQAVDDDAPGGKNSDVRYEILTGNYDRKFSIDSVTGVISVKEPLLDDDAIERRRRRNGKQSTGDIG